MEIKQNRIANNRKIMRITHGKTKTGTANNKTIIIRKHGKTKKTELPKIKQY